MQWSGEAIVLRVRSHGENALLLDVFAAEQGRYRGLLRGHGGRRRGGGVALGDRVQVIWRARLEDQLGGFQLEKEGSPAWSIFTSPPRLLAMAVLCELSLIIPEREPHRELFLAFRDCLEALSGPHWRVAIVRFELILLRELGYGLDLDRCVATGQRHDLSFVSPRSGCAVSTSAAAPYRDKLLPLPAFLISGDDVAASAQAIRDACRLTGYFLERRLFDVHGIALPFSRQQLLSYL